jgi:hypothetical protein
VFPSHHDVSAALGEAKKEAKRTKGSTLFVERRAPTGRLDLSQRHGNEITVSPAPTLRIAAARAQ